VKLFVRKLFFLYLKRFLPRVGDLVAGEIVALVVGLLAHVAHVVLLAQVHLLVDLQLAVEAECLGAEIALESLESGVDGVVVTQLGLADEHLVAHVAFCQYNRRTTSVSSNY
jgi:hypothetical protein